MGWLFGLKLSDVCVCVCVFGCGCSEVWYGVYVVWLNFTRPRDILFFFIFGIFNFKSGIYNFSHIQEYSILLGISQNSRNLIWDIPILRKFGIWEFFWTSQKISGTYPNSVFWDIAEYGNIPNFIRDILNYS